MHLTLLIEMIESGLGDRPVLGDVGHTVTGADLARLARGGAGIVRDRFDAVVFAGENHPLLPVALFASVEAGVPFVPVNYRLEDHQLNELVGRYPGALVLADARTAPRVQDARQVTLFGDWIDSIPSDPSPASQPGDDDDLAVVLFTSGTTAEPKAALLRHRHLMSYLLATVEFGSAGEDEAVLVSVPPYHVAGVANVLSNLYAGRRIVYLRSFDPEKWLDVVRRERITHAMVVPTMLSRIVTALGDRPADVPTLRSLAYGGARLAEPVLRSALRAFPDTGFVNAYGLTETASTIAVLGPDDHRAAITSDEPQVQRRLSSVGRVLPTIEVEIRNDADEPQPAGEPGLIYLRGEQIAGEYAGVSLLDADGWFCTRDRGYLDPDGYLFIEGRADDTIIRGGENIAPAEIETVLLAHPAIADACVVGVPDDEWGQRVVAVVVTREGQTVDAEELRAVVRTQLRGAKTPDRVLFRSSLPHTDTGKLLRRVVLHDLAGSPAPDVPAR